MSAGFGVNARAVGPRVALVLGLALWMALLIGRWWPAAAADSGFPITETFMNAQPGPGWKLGGVATTTAASGIDPAGQGWLRLTRLATYQSGYAIYDVPFSSTNGLYITFDYMTWGATTASNGADGLTVFLYNGSIPSNTFQTGSYGGSLGYAQRTNVNGLTGGYVGIGIDEFGNYSNPTEGRVGGPGFRPNAIAIRGPGTGTTGYAYLTGATVAGSLDVYGVTTRPNVNGTGYRKVEIDIEPLSGTYKITVKLQLGAAGALNTIINQYTLPSAPPANLKIGFAASTGGSINYHEIRNLSIASKDTSTILNGTVTASTGGAIPDATVRITDTVAHVYTSTVTGSGGYVFTSTLGTPLVAGPVSVTVTANGYCPATVRAQVVNGVTTTQNISLTPTTVSGLVLDAGTGVPIVGANVVLTDAVGTVFNTTSGSGGAYSFASSIGTRLRSGLITITASIVDYDVYSHTATIGDCANPINLPLLTTDLLVNKSDGRTAVAPGDTLTYTIAITNLGSLSAANVIITDTLSPYLTYVSDNSGVTPDHPSPNVYVWAWPVSLSPNQSLSFQVRTQLAAVLPDGTTSIYNTAVARTSSAEADITQNIRQDVDTVTAHPDLAIFKSATAASVPVTQTADIEYTYVVENRGYTTATHVVITDVLDANTGYTTSSAVFTLGGDAQIIGETYYAPTHTVIFELPDLAPNALGYFTYTARVTDTLSGSVSAVTNTATLGSAQVDADAADNTSAVALPAAAGLNLYVDKSAQPAPDPAVPGGEVLYTIRYGNLGSVAATNVVLTDAVLANSTYVANSLYLDGALLPDSTHYLSGSNMITVSWPTLAAGANGTLTFTVQIDSPLDAGVTQLDNAAWISATGGSQLELIPADNQAAVTTAVTAQPNLAVTIAEDPPQFLNGQPLTYTLTYQNSGNQTASGVIITAALLSNLTAVAAGPGGVYDPATGLVTWTLSSLPVNGPHSVTFTATISPTAQAGSLAAVRAAIGDDGTNGADADTSDNTALDSDVITRPYLTLVKSNSTPVYTGEPVTYTIDYWNAGAADAINVVITDAVPTNASLGTIFNGGTVSDGIITWMIGDVAAGGSGSIGFVATPRTTSGGTDQPAPTLSVEPGSGTIVITTTTNPAPTDWCDSADCARFKTLWQGSNPTRAAGWYDNPRLLSTSFDDSAWLSPTEVVTKEWYWTDEANLSAQWVTPLTLTRFAPNYSFFRQAFCLPVNATDLQATLSIANDDTSEIYLNGEWVGRKIGSGAAITLSTSEDLQAGINLLAIRLANNNHTGHPDYGGGDHIGLVYNLNTRYSQLKPFVAAPGTVLAGQTVTFTIDENAIEGRAPYSYTIDFGGSEGSQAYTGTPVFTHVYATPGTYTVTVTAREQLGCTGQDTAVIRVLAAATPLLINRAGAAYQNVNAINYAGESGVGEALQAAVKLDISKTSAAASFVPGQSTVTYTVIVTNSGVEAATNAAISDTLPADLAGVTWTCEPSAGGSCRASGSGALDDTVTLPAGGTLTYVITGTLLSSALGDVVNTIFALPPLDSVNVGTGSATDSKPTAPQADLSVTKTSTWITGSNVLTYTLTYTNAGPSDAREVYLTDTLPVSVTYQGEVGAAPAIMTLSPVGTAHTWYTPTLSAGVTGTVIFTVTVNTGITGTLTNTVSITSTTFEISAVDNAYEASVNVRSGAPTVLTLVRLSAAQSTARWAWLGLGGLVLGAGLLIYWRRRRPGRPA